ncbi:MAG: permease-like cell division protein FtsX [Oscillospiraceae bacterium]|jgi:cell division transport system permease protein|nr:permease-like cell division protein FtsX [Oscillospiraceae bacterium]
MKPQSMSYLTGEGLKNVWVNRMMSLASVGVLIACMLLIGVAVAFSLNVDKSLGTLQEQNVVMVYFEDGREETANLQSIDEIQHMDNIKDAVYIPKEEGLRAQLEQLGTEYEAIFSWLEEENPLPDGAMVTLSDLSEYDATYNALQALPGIKNVNGSRDVAMMVTTVSRIIGLAGFWIILLLMLIALVIIANTIRITIHNRRLEISIMKAVGATNWFIRIPFIVEGMALGVISGVLTTGLLYLVYSFATQSVNKYYPGQLELVPFRSFYLNLFGIFIAIGLFAGVAGSLVSLGKYLKREGSAFGAIH